MTHNWRAKIDELPEDQKAIRQEYNRQRYTKKKAILGDELGKRMLRNDRKRKYGVSDDDITSMQKRQQNRCPITRQQFTKTPHVDHSHETGQVRGLLSREANMAIGILKEDPEAFYRAVAYLTLDRNKKLVYVIGSLRNDSIPKVAYELRQEGFDVFDNWFSAGKTADDSWQEYSRNKGLTYTEALQSREANHVFRFDKAYLDLCDAAVLVMPAGKSGFLELGYVLGLGKPAYILLDEDTENNRYDVMPQFATMISSDIQDIIADLHQEI